jgi:predicted nucleic acid-binding protein
MNAIDTNIFIYSVDSRDRRKQDLALATLDNASRDDTITPWQVACEIGSVLRKHVADGTFDGDYAQTVRALRHRFPVVVPRDVILDEALELMREAKLSYWDSLLLASCRDAGVNRLYTEDLQGRATIAGVKMVNPLA